MTKLTRVPIAAASLLVMLCGVAAKAQAANLFFQPETLEAGVGETFRVFLVVNTQEEEINALGADIVFPSDLLLLENTSEGDSIINYWVEKPQKDAACGSVCRFHFSGVIPGGFNDSHGQILSLTFKGKQQGKGEVRLDNIELFRNDGNGTIIPTTGRNLAFDLKPAVEVKATPSARDEIPPEIFKPELSKSSSLFEGKWFAVFFTQDKQSGIDHYEVVESRSQATANFADLDWRVAESPFVLADQDLQSFVYVKAVDKEGNHRVAVLPPRYGNPQLENSKTWLIILIGLIISVVFVLRRLLGQRNKNESLK